MQRTTNILLYFLLIFALIACSGSKKYAKKATQFEEAGLFADATAFYMEALSRNPSNVEAKLGLSKVAQKALDASLDQFSLLSKTGKPKEAINAYLESESLVQQVKAYRLELNIPEFMENEFNEVKGNYLADVYEKGNQALEAREFKKAQNHFAEISRLEEGYGNIEKLSVIAHVEPIYEEAVAAFDNEKYRKAYNKFEQILSKDANYKDAAYYKDRSLEEGVLTVVVLPFESHRRQDQVSLQKFRAKLIDQMINYDDPFTKIIDREHLEDILNEQHLNMSGVIDQSTAAQAGELLGAKTAIKASIISFDKMPGRLSMTKDPTAQAYQVKVKDAEGNTVNQTRYRTIKINHYKQESRVDLSVQVQLVSLETGEVMFSKIIKHQERDAIDYALYDGNVRTLYPIVNNQRQTGRARRSFLTLFENRREIKPMVELVNQSYYTVSARSAGDLMRHIQAMD